jgi:hypothetical protein
MNTNVKLAIKALASIVVVDQLVAGIRNKKRCNRNFAVAQALTEENEHLRERLEASVERTNYMIDMMIEHGVPASEFDLIVLSTLT